MPAQAFAGFFMVAGCYLVFKDSLEGRYCPLHLQVLQDKSKQNKDFQYMTFWEQLKLAVWLAFELATIAPPGLVIYGAIPLMLAAVSLSRTGHKFEYIVAAKPEGANGPSDITFSYKPVGVQDIDDQMQYSRQSSKNHAISTSNQSTHAANTESETETETIRGSIDTSSSVTGKTTIPSSCTSIDGSRGNGMGSIPKSGVMSGYALEREEI